MLNLKQSLTEKSCNFPELRIVLMGSNAVGKTSVMNTIHNMKMTQEKSRTKECEMSVREIDNRKVILIDTPGWWPYASVQETPESVKQEIMSSVTMCPPGPHAALLVLQSGVAFTEAHRRSVKEHMELLGQNVWKYSIVVFTRGDWMSLTRHVPPPHNHGAHPHLNSNHHHLILITCHPPQHHKNHTHAPSHCPVTFATRSFNSSSTPLYLLSKDNLRRLFFHLLSKDCLQDPPNPYGACVWSLPSRHKSQHPSTPHFPLLCLCQFNKYHLSSVTPLSPSDP